MTIVINGTTGISGVDGSAGTPAVQGTDTNTGVFYPAADTVGVSTGGSEKMRIDSSGNVWIGQTSQVWDEKLGVRLATSGSGTVGLGVYSASTTYASSMIRVQAETGGSGWKMYEGRANGGSQLFWVDGSGGAYFAGNVGIGTSSPGAKLDVRGSSTFLVNATNPTAWVSVDSALTTGSMYNQWNTSSNVGISGTYTNHPYTFVTNNTERMRLDTSGNLLFNSGYGSVATAYGCRAWVNFNGTTASPSTIRGSGNVTSITKNATGNYTLNFTNAMPDANYSAVGSAGRANDGNNYVGFDTNTYSTTQVKFFTLAAGSAPSNTDMTGVYISIFR